MTKPEAEEGCGCSYDHDAETTYAGPEGVAWLCRACGAEGWEELG